MSYDYSDITALMRSSDLIDRLNEARRLEQC